MSEVSNQPHKMSFETLVSESEHVVVVKNLRQQVVVFQTTLPKETHYEKAMETSYQETAALYRVLRVLKSEKMTIGEEIRVCREPAYDLESIKQYHTTGVSASPVVLTYPPAYPPKGDELILFIEGPSRHFGVWMQYLNAAEDLAAEKEILAALKAPPQDRGIRPLR
jgi:hypothetical protein